MKLAEIVAQFFKTVDEVWGAIPGYVKVFLYSTLSSIAGLYFTGALTAETVLAIVLANLGLYSLPKGAGVVSKKLN